MRGWKIVLGRTSNRRGVATLTAILVLGFAFFLGISTCTNCSQILKLSAADSSGERARLTAEAGVNDALAQLKISQSWVPNSTHTNKQLPTTRSSTYTLTATNNVAGTAPVMASDGTMVPAGLVYVISKGTCNGATREVDVMVDPTSGFAPFSYALFGTSTSEEIEIEHGAQISAYSSSDPSGTYQAQVGGNGKVEVEGGGKVFGNVTAAGTIEVDGGGTVTGTTTPNKPVVSWPSVTVTPPSGTTVTSLTINSGQTVTLSAGTYYYTNIMVKSGGTLKITTGPVIVYMTGLLEVKSGGNVNNSTQIPSNFQVYSSNTSSDAIKLNNGSDLYGSLYAPNGGFSLDGGGKLYGSLVASKVDLGSGARIVYDMNLAGLTAPFSGTSSSVVVLSWDRH